VIDTEENTTKIVKREKGIWINLYEFPLIETLKPINENQLIEHEAFSSLFGETKVNIKLFDKKIKPHKLSHQHIYAKFWIIKIANSLNYKHRWEDIGKYPVPILIDNFLSEYKSD